MRRMLLLGMLCALCCANNAVAQAVAEKPATRKVLGTDDGVPTISWADAGKAVGEVAYVCGKVVRVRDIGSLTFINFDNARPAKFVAVVFRDNYGKFPNKIRDLYEGKLVKIRGQVTTHRDNPQIVITSPSQIEVVDALPETIMPKERVRKAGKDQLVVAAYNVLNLFDEVDDPYHEDETTPAKPQADLQHLAESIRALNADVLALEEVESRGFLQQFVNEYLADMGYEYVVHFDSNDMRGIDTCLLSRVPVGTVCSHRHVRFPGPDGHPRGMSRDLLCITLQPPGKAPFETWLLHLKSNHGGREKAEPIRMAEVFYVRKVLDQRLAKDPDARILLMGDFNDTWDSSSLKTLVGKGPTALKLPLSEPEIKSLVTYNKGDFQSMIDFILCSPAMAKEYVPGSYRSIPGSTETTGSDHNPVTAWFEME